MKNGTCPKCGAAEILQNAPVQAYATAKGSGSGQFFVELTEPADPHKWIQSIHTERFTFRAWVCVACGYTEFYVHESDRFHEVCKKDWYVASN